MTDLNGINQTESEIDKKAKELILSVSDQYTGDITLVVKWLNKHELSFGKDGVDQYMTYIRGVRENGTRYSANSYNKKISAIKNRIRLLFNNSENSLDALEQLRLQAYLDTLKYKKINSSEISESKVLTPEEIHILIDTADPRLSLMIEFLSKTGCRISEMINVLLSECTKKHQNYAIRVLGKGSKERTVFIEKELYRRITIEFNDSTYLFGHSGSPYNRISVTNRIKVLSKIELHNNASAHTLRHSFITTALKEGIAIEKISKYVGHSSVNITDKQYNHNTISWDELSILM